MLVDFTKGVLPSPIVIMGVSAFTGRNSLYLSMTPTVPFTVSSPFAGRHGLLDSVDR